MKTNTYLKLLITLITLTILVFQSCKKDDENTNQSPTCKITSPTNGLEIAKGKIVTISVEANDNDGNIIGVRFFVNGIEKSSTPDPPYNYEWHTDSESLGDHLLTATSIDNGGDSSSDEITVEIIQAGNSDFNADQTSGVVPLLVNFTDSSSNNPTSWQWDFGDGSSSDEQNPSHTYNEIGTYTVTLITSNGFNADTISKADLLSASNTGVFTDPRDGQTYDIANIGGQVWFAENLNFEIADSWWYENDPANGDVYGRLYTWEAALAAAPDGWHLPTDDEWKALEIFLGMSQIEADGKGLRGTDEGTKLKSTSGWNSGGNGTNIVGFTALPGGRGNNGASFERLGHYGYWWTSTESSDNSVWYRRLFSDHTGVTRFDPPPDGSSNTLLMGERLVRD